MNHIVKIVVIFVVAILINVQSSFAQRDIERRVYYLDITASMEGYNGSDNIWQDVKKNLKNAFSNIPDSTTEILVLTFTDKNHSVDLVGNHIYKAKPNDIDMLCAEIDKIKTVQNCHTDIYVPFQDFYNLRITKGRVNCFFLLTDGKQLEKGNDLLKSEIYKWQIVTNQGREYIYGWYLMLTDAARVSNIKSWIGDSEVQDRNHLWAVESADVNLNLVRFQNCFDSSLDVRKDSFIYIPFKYCPEGVGLKVSVEGSNDNYDVGQPQISNDRKQLSMKITPQRGKKLSGIQPKSILQLKFELTSKPNKYTWLMTDRIAVVCKNNLSPSLTNVYFDKKEKESTFLGKLKRYPSLCSLSEDTVGIVDTLFFFFDDDAIAKGNLCRARFQLVNEKGDTISFSKIIDSKNREIGCSQFEVSPMDTFKVFRFRFDSSDVDGGIYHVRLKLLGVDSLKSVVNCPLDSFINKPIIASYTIEYEKNCNPIWWWLLCFLLLLLAIVSAIIVAFIVHRLLAPRFPKDASIKFHLLNIKGENPNIKMFPCSPYENINLVSSGKGFSSKETSNVLLTCNLGDKFVERIVIATQQQEISCPKRFTREWFSREWNGDTIYVRGIFNNNYQINKIIIILIGTRLNPSAKITIDGKEKEETLDLYKLSEKREVTIAVNDSVQLVAYKNLKTK